MLSEDLLIDYRELNVSSVVDKQRVGNHLSVKRLDFLMVAMDTKTHFAVLNKGLFFLVQARTTPVVSD